MPRTDFTSEIDGALAGRNLGSRHFSDVARSGNGNMLDDLSEADLSNYDELDGMGETTEELTRAESAQIDKMGRMAKITSLREPVPGEVPPFAPKPGMAWMRKRTITDQRKPGGNRIARVKWVQITPSRLQAMAKSGQVAGMGAMSLTTGIAASTGIGIVAGLALWLIFKRKG